MSFDEVNVAANCFIQQLQKTMTRMLLWHQGKGVGEVLDQ
jgi:hypothetical protein